MPQFLSRAREWFSVRPPVQKILIIVVAALVLVFASQVVAAIAGLIFLASLIALVVQLVRRRPIKVWAIAAGGALVVALIFGGIAWAIYGPSGGGTQEEVPQEEVPQEAQQEEAEPEPEPEAKPRPQPPELQKATLTVDAAVSAVEAEGYTCDISPAPRADMISWSCLYTGTGKSYTASIYAPDPNSENATMIEADVNGAVVSVGEAGEVLGEIAVLPDMSEEGEARAREWVAHNIATVDAGPDLEDTVVSTTVEGVRYELHGGDPSYRLLVMELPT